MKGVAIAGVQLRCPRFEESLEFFVRKLGMAETRRGPDRAELRCIGEEAEWTLALREAPAPGLDFVLVRTEAEPDGQPWLRSPAGHELKLTSGLPAALPYAGTRPLLNQPLPMRGVGVEPRRLAHVGLVVADVEADSSWWQEELGFVLRESVEDGEGTMLATVAVTAQACDVMLLRGVPRHPGALHHVAFAVDQRDTIARAALLFAEHEVPVEVGLGQHGLGQYSYLYCLEPSGNRIALVHSPLLHLGGEASPVRWPAESTETALFMWGAPPNASFFENHT